MRDKYAKAWEKIKAAARWTRKNEEGVGGFAVLLFFAALGIYSCITAEPVTQERKKPEKEHTTIRQDMSDIWHHAKCAVKFCDEDGRCPVWSSKYSKCYMLDKHAREFLKEYEKETSKETFEEVFVK